MLGAVAENARGANGDSDPNASLKQPPANLGEFYDPKRRTLGYYRIWRGFRRLLGGDGKDAK